MSWKRANSYGKSALKVNIDLSGFDEYLEKIEKAGKDIGSACKSAINESLPIIKNDMVAGAQRHKRNGDVLNAIEVEKAKQEGNYFYGEVGINLDKHPEAKEAVFQEYGDGHSPCFPDPFIHPAMQNNKAEIKKVQRAVLKKAGIPIE